MTRVFGIALGFVCPRRLFASLAFFAVVALAAPTDTAAVPSADTPVAGDSAVAASDTASADTGSFWSRYVVWSFEHIIQPTLNAIVYPIAQPLHYAFDNGVIETAVDLITFGEKRNVLLYPIMNLKPGNSTMLGLRTGTGASSWARTTLSCRRSTMPTATGM